MRRLPDKPPHRRRALVIGYGNTLRGDDGLGWVVADLLAQRLAPELAQIIACHQLTIDLAEPISRARRLVLIDARADGPPGEVRKVALQPDAAPESNPCAHHIGPKTLLAAAEMLYGAAPPALLVTVSGFSFAHSASLSEPMQRALPSIIGFVEALVCAE